MRSILEELFFGMINPNLEQFKDNEPYTQAMETIQANQELLMEHIDEESGRLLVQMADAFSEVLAIVSVERFAEGARIGGRLIQALLEE